MHVSESFNCYINERLLVKVMGVVYADNKKAKQDGNVINA